MLNITVRAAQDNEKLNVDEDADELPKGVRGFDGTDWDAQFIVGLKGGDWIVEIQDPDNILNQQQSGLFVIQHNGEDGGFYRKIEAE